MDLPRDYLENSPSSQLISTALAGIAKFETARRKERQRQGIEAAKGWNEPIPGTHPFNSGTGNDLFFADDGFKFHTGMNLNAGQRIDLEDNNNNL